MGPWRCAFHARSGRTLPCASSIVLHAASTAKSAASDDDEEMR